MSHKDVVKSIFRACGFDIRRYKPVAPTEAQLVAMLRLHDVNLVFDVGANTGQFGQLLRRAGYGGRIVSFEPLAAARSGLMLTSAGDPQWQVAPQAAIGTEDGEIEIHVSSNSLSSSVLGMLGTHLDADPESAYVGSEIVPLHRLDGMAPSYLTPEAVLFINIDTQGYEDRVLQGAPDTIAKARGLQLELSLVPLYEGQKMYMEIITQVRHIGFELWGINSIFSDPRSGRLLQVDATFFRP